MNLEDINSPKDLKAIPQEDLPRLCNQIRDLIIEVVSKNGGHLASSLGAVELAVALQYCLDTPQDSIVYDVGHQTYAHKIITGRRDKFSNLRKYQGISGFPNYNESVYDIYISGHASTAISWAQGIAEAKKIKNISSKTVAVVGDGSLTGGMCFEALNSCGHAQSDVLVILNHNQMSISPSVGALSKYLTKILTAPRYNRLKQEVENILGKTLMPKIKKIEEAMKGLVVPGVFFEELGFRYFGPIDGHNILTLIETLKNLLVLPGPRILHIVTKKGKGISFCEDNPERFHGVSVFNKDTGESLSLAVQSYSQAFANKLTKLAKEDKAIVAITAAMPEGTGLDIFKKEIPQRFFDVAIAEPHAVGLASGFAKQGLKPVVAIYSTFLQRAFDQIIHDIALQNLNVIFAIDRAGVVGEDGPTHHGNFDIGYLRLIPNMVCMAPKDKEELEDMLAFSLQLKSPVSIRYPKGKAISLGAKEEIILGKAQVLEEGQDLAIIALGAMVETAIGVANILKQEGKNITVINARFIKPLDEDLLIRIAKTHRYIFTLEDANISCGFSSTVLEFLQANNLLDITKVVSFGFPDEFIPAASREELFSIYGLDCLSIVKKINKLLQEDSIYYGSKN